MNIGTLWVTLAADFSQLDKMTTGLNTIAQRFRTFGYLASTALTLPILAAGKASFQLARDYEFSMQKIVGLTGVAQSAVNGWSADILKMGPEVAKGPKELAEALYFISSSGIKGQEAMTVLNLSAKAASAGLGETSAVANVLTSALNAYKGTGLTAAYATDVLIAGVREGKAEAAGFATAIGQLIPLAAQLGVSFDQVAGGVAAVTLTGASAANAAVYMKGIFNTLITASTQGKNALDKMGSSYGQLRNILANQGLVPLMQKLRDMQVKYGDELMSDVIPNIRAMTFFLSFAGKNFQYNTELMKRVTASTGSLGKAFAAVADTIKVRYDQAISQAQGSMISLGKTLAQVFLPLLEKLVKKLEEATNWFNGLSEAQKQHKVTQLAVIAVLGPLSLLISVITYSVSGLAKGISLLGKAMLGLNFITKGLGGSFSQLRTMMQFSPILTKILFTISKFAGSWVGALVLAIPAVIIGLNKYQNKIAEIAKAHDSFNTTLVKVNGTLQKLKDLTPADYGAMTLQELNAAQIAVQQEWVKTNTMLNQGYKNKEGFSFFERLFGSNKNNDKFIQEQQDKIAQLKTQYEGLGDTYYDVWKKSLLEGEIKRMEKLTAGYKELREEMTRLHKLFLEQYDTNLKAGPEIYKMKMSYSFDKTGLGAVNKIAGGIEVPKFEETNLTKFFRGTGGGESGDLAYLKGFQKELDLISLKNKVLGDSFNTGRAQLSYFKETLEKLWDSGLRPGVPLMDNLIKQMKQLTIQQEIVDGLRDSFANFFASVISGTESMTNAFKQMGQQIIQVFARMAGEMIAEGIMKLIMSLIGGPGLSMGISAAQGLASRNFMSFANGTNYAPGGWSMVGEKGPELLNLPGGSKIFPNGVGNIGMQPAVIQGEVVFEISENTMKGFLNKMNKKNNLY
jgi:TP901 family phage tail tape measure protein